MSNVIAKGISSTLKETEKEVVRENIGAASQADMTAVESRASEVEADITELSTPNNSRTKAALNATGNAPIFACRVWGNFNGLNNNIAIRNGGNFASVERLAAGKYRVTMQHNVPHVDYTVHCNAASNLDSLEGAMDSGTALNFTNSTFEIWTTNNTSAAGYQDCELVTFSVIY